jgi:acetaldehyde dehydrogenase / alcohol dehydrogenase
MTATTNREQDLVLMERANHYMRQARLAAAVFTQYSQAQVDKIVKAMTICAIKHAPQLAMMAHEETRMGVTEDKILKNFVASEFLYHQIKDKPTVGIVNDFPDLKLVEMAEPMGVIFAMSPVTNPTSTVIFKSICAAKTRNSIVFSAHLMAADSSNYAAKLLYEAALEAGAPKGFISWVDKSSRLRRLSELMMTHPEVDLIFATGGTQMVKAAYSSGKPALGVGSGNTPVYVHKSANVASAAMEIIISKTFDNGTECPSEQTLIIDREISQQILVEFKRNGCYICNDEETEKVTEVVIDPRTGGMNYRMVGQPASVIAKAAGLTLDGAVKLILCPMKGELRHHRLAVEKLMPVLGYVLVDSVEEGLNRSLDINYAGGTGHTAGIYAEDESVIDRFATVINAGRIIVNSPSSIGGLGGVYNHLNTTLSFGCGTGGGNITTDNVGIKNLLNYKRVPRRKPFLTTFSTTKNIYVNPGSIEQLKSLKCSSVFIMTTPNAEKRGHLAMVTSQLPENTKVVLFSEMHAEPDFAIIQKAVAAMNECRPDTIIALGGGSVLDAAKLVRLFYDYPQLSIEDVSVDFVDFNHRMDVFPKEMKTQLVVVPTTSGTGSEVTPFAVFKDGNRKVSLIDECLLPDVAIVDADFTRCLPLSLTADTAFDALTHALEALVSVFATDYTDGLALEAMRLIFEALPETAKEPDNVLYRHKLHHAATLAGMAIGNASVGVNHALAHAVGARFEVPHGRANAAFLLSTIEYNSQVPSKFVTAPCYPLWIADLKYARAAQFLGLKDAQGGTNPEQDEACRGRLIKALRQAIYDLGRLVQIPLSVAELGITVADFEAAVPNLTEVAMGDLAIRTNPGYVLAPELLKLFVSAYLPRQRPE